ncbi:MAG: type IV pilus twitching motility protein PilT [Candidatus Omnitrophota bacterium]|nr:type IV pilus twitching motility protein PilT [Candidatus Omnitrophota bacterium]
MSSPSASFPARPQAAPPGDGASASLPEAASLPASAVLTDVRALFQLAFDRHASDIHLTEHTPPMVRIDGHLEPTELAPLTRADTKRLIYSLLTDRHKAQFERELELDISIEVQGLGRFRVNVHMQRGSVEAAFRLVPSHIRSLQELGLPPIVAELARKPNGLVLVTGPTGMGKTTTLTAMVDQINHEQRYHIIVIEDPIEYVHCNHRSIIKQREVYSDTKSFANALVRALRQDPNVIVVGEMRDLETIATTLTAAETGHLVLATLHTPDAAQTIDRILDVFPSHRQEEVKVQLADCLQGVISQRLLPRIDRPGRVLAYEVMVGTPAVRNLIREHATEQIPTTLQTGAQYGMCTMDACIKGLYDRQIIASETALSYMKHSGEFHLLGQQDASHKKRNP